MHGRFSRQPNQLGEGHAKILFMAKKTRIDQALVDKELTHDLEEARRLVMAGKILMNDQVVIQPSQMVGLEDSLRIKPSPQYVSRGGEKLQAAFQAFPFSIDQCVCADIGASTGGFTDCMLQYGAKKVYAVDVGYGILDWGLRNDPRVISLERTNARELAALPEAIDFFTVDVSFISLKKILPVAVQWYGPSGGQAVILVKPQFEASREEAAKGTGVIRDPMIHQRILQEILGFAAGINFLTKGLIRSPLLGPEGNIEFLALLEYPSDLGQDKIIRDRVSELF